MWRVFAFMGLTVLCTVVHGAYEERWGSLEPCNNLDPRVYGTLYTKQDYFMSWCGTNFMTDPVTGEELRPKRTEKCNQFDTTYAGSGLYGDHHADPGYGFKAGVCVGYWPNGDNHNLVQVRIDNEETEQFFWPDTSVNQNKWCYYNCVNENYGCACGRAKHPVRFGATSCFWPETGYACEWCAEGRDATHEAHLKTSWKGSGAYDKEGESGATYEQKRDYAQLRHCESCGLGWTRAPKGFACDTCPAGKYGQEKDVGKGLQAMCYSCEASKYQPSRQATTCLACPVGKYSGSNAAQCLQCGGNAKTNAARTGCEFCSEGLVNEYLTECTQCPQGKTLANLNSKYDCYDCPAGKYGSSKNVCSPCSPGTYSLSGATECIACEVGKTSSKESGSCTIFCESWQKSNYESLSKARTCQNCPEGQQAIIDKNGFSSENCRNCNVNFYRGSIIDNNACKACEDHQFQYPPSGTDATLVYKPTRCFTCQDFFEGIDDVLGGKIPFLFQRANDYAVCVSCVPKVDFTVAGIPDEKYRDFHLRDKKFVIHHQLFNTNDSIPETFDDTDGSSTILASDGTNYARACGDGTEACPATQSTIQSQLGLGLLIPDPAYGNDDFGWDGRLIGLSSGLMQCTITGDINKPGELAWWQVNLEQSIVVSALTLRGVLYSYYSDKSVGYDIIVLRRMSGSEFGWVEQPCKRGNQALSKDGTGEKITCDSPVEGSVVRIQLPAKPDEGRVLGLCEVQVWGRLAGIRPPIRTADDARGYFCTGCPDNHERLCMPTDKSCEHACRRCPANMTRLQSSPGACVCSSGYVRFYSLCLPNASLGCPPGNGASRLGEIDAHMRGQLALDTLAVEGVGSTDVRYVLKDETEYLNNLMDFFRLFVRPGKASTFIGALPFFPQDGQTSAAGVDFVTPNAWVCAECAPGEIATNRSDGLVVCEACPAGKYATGGRCVNCSAGTFSSRDRSIECELCALHHSTDGLEGQTECVWCLGERDGLSGYANVPGLANCSYCEAGKYMDIFLETEAVRCELCDPFRVQPRKGQKQCDTCDLLNPDKPAKVNETHCERCEAGTYVKYTLKYLGTCEPCQAGKYTALANQGKCEDSNKGYFSIGTDQRPCPPGSYSDRVGSTECTPCETGKYQAQSEQTTCLLCTGYYKKSPSNDDVWIVRYQDSTNQTSCLECNDNEAGTPDPFDSTGKRMIGCKICPEFAFQGQCDLCPVGFRVKDDGGCEVCPAGMTTLGKGARSCEECVPCPDGFYNAECSDTTTCMPCPACQTGFIRVGCMNTAGRPNRTGTCIPQEIARPTAVCPATKEAIDPKKVDGDSRSEMLLTDWRASPDLGGFSFGQVFGVAPTSVDFQCSRTCDGTSVFRDPTNPEAIPDYGIVDTGYCAGPYACNIQACSMLSLNGEAMGCPREDPEYQEGLDLDAYDEAREQSCQTCQECGTGSSAPDFGRGCAKECSYLICSDGQVFDWTRTRTGRLTDRCAPCSELYDVRLCSAASAERLGLALQDVSGMLPRVRFIGCVPRSSELIIDGGESRYATPAYGDCEACDAGGCVEADEYQAGCSESGAPVCRPCSVVSGVALVRAAYRDPTRDVDAERNLSCQVPTCRGAESFSGIRNGELCVDRCDEPACSPSEISLPCVLPQPTRCVARWPPTQESRWALVAETPAHTNLLEAAYSAAPQLFASFENLLVDPEREELRCVWNADVRDNNMDPGGADAGTALCRPLVRDPEREYPLLPTQNTVLVEGDASRRFLLDAPAWALVYGARPFELEAAFPYQPVVAQPGTGNTTAGSLALEINATFAPRVQVFAPLPESRNLSRVQSWLPAVELSVLVRMRGDSRLRARLRMGTQRSDENFIQTNGFTPTFLSRAVLPSGAIDCRDLSDTRKVFNGTDLLVASQPVTGLEEGDAALARLAKTASRQAWALGQRQEETRVELLDSNPRRIVLYSLRGGGMRACAVLYSSELALFCMSPSNHTQQIAPFPGRRLVNSVLREGRGEVLGVVEAFATIAVADDYEVVLATFTDLVHRKQVHTTSRVHVNTSLDVEVEFVELDAYTIITYATHGAFAYAIEEHEGVLNLLRITASLDVERFKLVVADGLLHSATSRRWTLAVSPVDAAVVVVGATQLQVVRVRTEDGVVTSSHHLDIEESVDVSEASAVLLHDESLLLRVDGQLWRLTRTGKFLATDRVRWRHRFFASLAGAYVTVELERYRQQIVAAEPVAQFSTQCAHGFEKRSVDFTTSVPMRLSHALCAQFCRDSLFCVGYLTSGDALFDYASNDYDCFIFYYDEVELLLYQEQYEVTDLEDLRGSRLFAHSLCVFDGGVYKAASVTGSGDLLAVPVEFKVVAVSSDSLRGSGSVEGYAWLWGDPGECEAVGGAKIDGRHTAIPDGLSTTAEGFLEMFEVVGVDAAVDLRMRLPFAHVVLRQPCGGETRVFLHLEYAGNATETHAIPPCQGTAHADVVVWSVRCGDCAPGAMTHAYARIDGSGELYVRRFAPPEALEIRIHSGVQIVYLREVESEQHAMVPPLRSLFVEAAVSRELTTEWGVLRGLWPAKALAGGLVKLEVDNIGDLTVNTSVVLDDLRAVVVLSSPDVVSVPDLCVPGWAPSYEAGQWGVCAECPPGTTAATAGSLACVPCPPGTFSPNTSATACSKCPAGTALARAGGRTLDECVECAAGTFAGAGAGECAACPPGSVSAYVRATQCDECAAGKYAAGVECRDCWAGKFALVSGSVACSPCAAGTASAEVGRNTTCGMCEAGKYAVVGQTECSDCPSNTYSAERGLGSVAGCRPCIGGESPAGSVTVGDCSCAPGFWGQGIACRPCPDGATSAPGAPNASACFCLPGYEGTAWECRACPAGKSGVGGGVCVDCPANTYAAETGQTACSECPVSQISLPGASECFQTQCHVCDAGSYSDAGASVCSSCQAGKYSIEASGVCQTCASGTYSELGQESCQKCPALTYSREGSSCLPCTDETARYFRNCACGKGALFVTDKCVPCAADEEVKADKCVRAVCEPGEEIIMTWDNFTGFNFIGNDTHEAWEVACRNCTAGTYSRDGRACLPCASGSVSNASAAECHACPADTFAVGSECVPCAPGSVTPDPALPCQVCPANTYATSGRCEECEPGLFSYAGSVSELECRYVPGRRMLVATTLLPTQEQVNDLALNDDVLREVGHGRSPLQGDDVSDWRRLHVTARVHDDGAAFAGCRFRISLAEVGVLGQVVERGRLRELGCSLVVGGMSGFCVLEIPYVLRSAAGFVAVTAAAERDECEWPDHFAVSLEPLQALYECVSTEFWSEELGRCQSCELEINTGLGLDRHCPPGQHIPGCDVLARTDACQPCDQPEEWVDGRFEWVPGEVCNYRCVEGYVLQEGRCEPCSRLLEFNCSQTAPAGQRWQACTAEAQERCVDCALTSDVLGGAARFVLGSKECATVCNQDFYLRDSRCLECSTAADLLESLTIREVGVFYRFAPCQAAQDARLVRCGAVEHGTVVGDASGITGFCQLRCDPGYFQAAGECRECVEPSLPAGAYTFDASTCVVTCNQTGGWFDRNGTCRYCMQQCQVGEYVGGINCSCQECEPMHRTPHWVFASSGLLDQPQSCLETCLPGFFADYDICRPWSVLECAPGEFIENGTATADASCVLCSDCEGSRLVEPCGAFHDASCEPCPPATDARVYLGTNCSWECPLESVLNRDSGLCEPCSFECPLGSAFPSDRRNCTHCEACAEIPIGAFYTGPDCRWSCPAGWASDGAECLQDLGAGADVFQSTFPRRPGLACPVLRCPAGQQLAFSADACPACQACEEVLADFPPHAQLNVTWVWLDTVLCRYSCRPGYMRYRELGVVVCLTPAEYDAKLARREVTVDFQNASWTARPPPPPRFSWIYVAGFALSVMLFVGVLSCVW